MYFELGLEHILDINGYDHILFVLALCATYQVKEWRKIVILVTAFTIGHSLTLALAALDKISFNPATIEVLIPVTIIITGLVNILMKEKAGSKILKLKYLITFVFGLIHGLGFSNYFRALLSKASEVVKPLFFFNIGVEVGQLIIVTVAIALSYITINKLKVNQKYWNYTLSGIAILV
ncbi:MAG TPA: HupE/UreJ family protein, partial [Saprospiraceae bacterium]|nr:HupE/UreJ family protein [Saprospiraceae bacterium]